MKVVQSPMRPDQPMGCGWRGWGVRERGGEQLSSQIGSSAVAAGADAGWRAPPPPPMRPQLLYLLLALTRVAGAWDALLADDGTIDLGGNVVAVAEDPDDLMLNMMDIGEGALLRPAGARRRPPRQQPATVVDGTRFDDYQSTMLNLLQEAIPERPGRMQARHRRRRVARRHQRHHPGRSVRRLLNG